MKNPNEFVPRKFADAEYAKIAHALTKLSTTSNETRLSIQKAIGQIFSPDPEEQKVARLYINQLLGK